jgi:hypothetical protein
MQGIESLDNFKSFVSSLGGLGRFEDTYIVHAAEGETVVPMEVLDKNPALKKRLFKTMMDMGIQPGRYIVGNELNSKNPVTGQPEFFLKKIVSQIRKALPGDSEKYLGTVVGLATGNPFLGALAGGIGSGAQGALAGGLTGFQSPGIAGLTGDVSKGGFLGGRDLFGRTKTSPLDLTKLLSGGGGSDELSRFLRGTTGEDASGLLGSKGKFIGQDFFTGSGDTKTNKYVELFQSIGKDKLKELAPTRANEIDAIFEGIQSSGGDSKKLGLGQKLAITLLGGFIGDKLGILGGDDQDIGLPRDTMPEGRVLEGIVNPEPIFAAEGGGVMDLRQGGESEGPGTGTSDDIPAMLSDGEFVMTAKAVRGAGGGDRREGAKKMYEAMDKLEAQA